MKKIILILLIFSTFVFCKKDDLVGDGAINQLTKEDMEKLKDFVQKIILFIQNILNDYKDSKTEGEKLIYEVLEKIYEVLEILKPLLDSDPQTFLFTLMQISDKINLEEYFNKLFENTYVDVIIDAYFSFLSNENIFKIYDSLKDDIFYFLKKFMNEENAVYIELIEEVYPNIINLIKSDEYKEFWKKCLLIQLYNQLGKERFSKEYDVKVLGEEAKEIYNDKIKNNEDFKIIVSKITEKIPFISQSMIDSYINSYIDSLVNNTFEEDYDY